MTAKAVKQQLIKSHILQRRKVKSLMSKTIVLILIALTASCALIVQVPQENINPEQDSSKEVKSLDVTWEIIFDHENIGRDADWHLNTLEQTLSNVEKWMETTLPNIQEREALRDPFAEWEYARWGAAGLGDDSLHPYSLAMPLGMGADGIWRYWDKFRADEK